jgi:cellulase/cellobiase CelA1
MTENSVQAVYIGLATNGSVGLTSVQIQASPVVVSAPFTGTLIAPSATLTLGSGTPVSYPGAFYARVLNVANDNQVACNRNVAALTTAPPGIAANVVVTNDWGSGYCAQLLVTNVGSQATTNWWVNLDSNQSTIYDHWNGNFSAASGTVGITPSFGWNQVIAPGVTDESIGFCTNRNTPASTVANVLAAWGSY